MFCRKSSLRYTSCSLFPIPSSLFRTLQTLGVKAGVIGRLPSSRPCARNRRAPHPRVARYTDFWRLLDVKPTFHAESITAAELSEGPQLGVRRANRFFRGKWRVASVQATIRPKYTLTRRPADLMRTPASEGRSPDLRISAPASGS